MLKDEQQKNEQVVIQVLGGHIQIWPPNSQQYQIKIHLTELTKSNLYN